MNTNNSITAAVFFAFLKCPTKAYLLTIGESAPTTFFSEIEANISLMYKSAVTRKLPVGAEVTTPLDFGELLSSRNHEAVAHPVDCKTAIYNLVLSSDEPGVGRSRKSMSPLCFHPGTNRMFPTPYWCVSVRLHCRRSRTFCQTQEL